MSALAARIVGLKLGRRAQRVCGPPLPATGTRRRAREGDAHPSQSGRSCYLSSKWKRPRPARPAGPRRGLDSALGTWAVPFPHRLTVPAPCSSG